MREGLCRVLIGPAVFGVLDQSGGDSPNGHPRAANELTITEWNPVSKQPLFKVGEGHAAEADVYHTCNTLAKQCEAHAEMLGPFVDRYDEEKPAEPDCLYHELFDETRSGGLGLLRDMQDLYLMAHRHRVDHDRAGRPGRRRQGTVKRSSTPVKARPPPRSSGSGRG